MSDENAFYRILPSMDRLLSDPRVTPLIDKFGRDFVRDALRDSLGQARQTIRDGKTTPTTDVLVALATHLLRVRDEPTLRPVINATGIILQTNLGRAPLSEEAQQAILSVAGGYSTLEYRLEEGKRGKRDSHVERLVTAITGAEAALVVNNNAAAVMLILATFARDREVIISRGQLVEIGGGFRIPDVMKDSGARLIEVGTTNRTNIEDFKRAISPDSAILMRAHASNFKQIGFTTQPALKDVAEAAHASNLIAVDDLGSGALLDTAVFGLAHEPTVQESLRAGFDLVAFSGDKLLGGPQSGIIAGKAPLIEQLKKHPLARAMRIDKLSLAGLVATLGHYQRNDAVARIPIWRMIAMEPKTIRARAELWAAQVGGRVIRSKSAVGGGSLPGATLPTYVLALESAMPDELTARLRRGPTPVIARISHERVLLDPRTVLPGQDSSLIETVRAALHTANGV